MCHELSAWNKWQKSHIFFSQNVDPRPPEHNLVVRENIHSLNKQHFGTSLKSCVAYRVPTRFLHYKLITFLKGMFAPGEIISREIWEGFQLIDISTVWQPKSNYLKRAKSGWKRVVKEMITGSLCLPFSRPSNFKRAFYFRGFPTIWEPGTGYRPTASQPRSQGSLLPAL